MRGRHAYRPLWSTNRIRASDVSPYRRSPTREAVFVVVNMKGGHGRRTTNPIESTFATVRHRTRQTKGCGSRVTALTMAFKLTTQAQRHWRRLNNYQLISHLIDGAIFADGELQLKQAA